MNGNGCLEILGCFRTPSDLQNSLPFDDRMEERSDGGAYR